MKYFTQIIYLLLILFLVQNSNSALSQENTIFERTSSQIGATDYSNFYCAYKLWKNKQNPYDIDLLNSICKDLPARSGLPQLSYMYPPWLLPMLSPLFELNFKYSVASWYILNVFMIIASGILIWKIYNIRKINLVLCGVGSLVFPPLFESLEWGQISIFVTFGIALFLWSITNNKNLIAGISSIIILLKFHLLLPWGIFTLLWLIKEKKISVLLISLLLLLAAIAFCEFHIPGILNYWILSRNQTLSHGAISKTSNLVSILTMTFPNYPQVFFYSIPTIGIIIAIYAFYKNKLSFLQINFALLCLSLLCSPYSWYHDFSILQIIQVAIVAKQLDEEKALKQTMPLIILFQLSSIILSITIFKNQYQLFWYPILIYGLWALLTNQQKIKD